MKQYEKEIKTKSVRIMKQNSHCQMKSWADELQEKLSSLPLSLGTWKQE
jgi:hypothetical protein